ncbi:MAG TPA: metal-sensitive transcriptional regulator [Phycisphaerales bacterium]|nr:metal-sensitive transcriptional regulator [Phycisphaerales bacterium]
MQSSTDQQKRTYLDDGQARSIVNALSRIEGHVGSVKRMVDERRCADELLTQIAAIKAALNRVTVKLVEGELRLCLTQCGAEDADERFAAAMRALSSMLKRS